MTTMTWQVNDEAEQDKTGEADEMNLEFQRRVNAYLNERQCAEAR